MATLLLATLTERYEDEQIVRRYFFLCPIIEDQDASLQYLSADINLFRYLFVMFQLFFLTLFLR
jgi:hypothetical protein